MNPIFVREWQARWRDLRSYLLLLGFVALLALVAWWIYSSAFSGQTRIVNYNIYTGMPIYAAPQNVASETGRELFQNLTLGNCVVCLLLSGVLAAPGIARERERGLIESLQLSHMHPFGQIAARFFSALAFLLALEVATLPVYGVAFLLGGVSPGEVGQGVGLVLATLVLGAALGVWFSARSYRPSSAVSALLGSLALWSLASWLLALDVGPGAPMPSLTFGYFGLLHPVVLFYHLTHVTTMAGPGFANALQDWLDGAFRFSMQFYVVLVPLLLWSAARKVNKSLPLSQWQGRNRGVEKWKARLRQARAAERPGGARVSHQVQGALIADLPLDKFVRFRDPLLTREVRSRFRLRKGNFFVSLLRLGVFLSGAGAWALALLALTDPYLRSQIPYDVLCGDWGLGVATVCVLAAGSFTRERESGTWEGLRLSLLRPAEVVRAKWQSVLVSFFYYTLPLWTLVPVALVLGYGDLVGRTILLLLVIGSSLGAFCAFGLWVSWRSPHPTAALSWTLGIALLLLVAWPQLEQSVGLEGKVTGLMGQNNYSVYPYYGGYGGSYGGNYGGYYYNSDGYMTSSPAHQLWLWLHVWQPRAALEVLNPYARISTYNVYLTHPEPRNDVGDTMVWLPLMHTLLALGVTAFFLARVRRGIIQAHE